MATDIRGAQNRMVILFLINVVLALLGPGLVPIFANLTDYLISFGVGAVLLGIFDRHYLRYIFWSIIFVGYLLWQIVLSNLSLAWLIVQPKPKLDPGIVAIPLTVSTGLEITVLATAITLTPGTLSVDLGTDDDDGRVLYVHNLKVKDPEEFRASVKNGFERLILNISRGAS